MSAALTGPQQYLRRCSLTIDRAGGPALDLSQLQIKFQVQQSQLQSPNIAKIRVFNLAEHTIHRIGAQAEFTDVLLQAGYTGSFGPIFTGSVVWARMGRQGATNYMEMQAADGDAAYTYSTIGVALAAGSTAQDVVAACLKAMAPYGVTEGSIPADLPNIKMPRGRVLFGMTRDVLRQVGQMLGCSWSISHGVITFIPEESYLQGNAVVLTSSTGLIGLPEQTQDGIMIKCLINPQITVGRMVTINNTLVNKANYNLSYTGVVNNALLPSVANDGNYRVLAIDYSGDTRGQDWYCILTCISLDGTLPISQAARGRVLPPLASSDLGL